MPTLLISFSPLTSSGPDDEPGLIYPSVPSTVGIAGQVLTDVFSGQQEAGLGRSGQWCCQH